MTTNDELTLASVLSTRLPPVARGRGAQQPEPGLRADLTDLPLAGPDQSL